MLPNIDASQLSISVHFVVFTDIIPEIQNTEKASRVKPEAVQEKK